MKVIQVWYNMRVNKLLFWGVNYAFKSTHVWIWSAICQWHLSRFRVHIGPVLWDVFRWKDTLLYYSIWKGICSHSQLEWALCKLSFYLQVILFVLLFTFLFSYLFYKTLFQTAVQIFMMLMFRIYLYLHALLSHLAD